MIILLLLFWEENRKDDMIWALKNVAAKSLQVPQRIMILVKFQFNLESNIFLKI